MAKGTCSIGGCGKPHFGRGWCRTHYSRWFKTGDPSAAIPVKQRAPSYPPGSKCTIGGCGMPILARGWCVKHYQSWRHHGDPLATTRELLTSRTCAVETCDRQANEPGGARGWCQSHYNRWQRHGDPEANTKCWSCGCPLRLDKGTRIRFCTINPECRQRQAAIDERARELEEKRATWRQWRAENPEAPARTRAAMARHMARTDRSCVRPGCGEFALKGSAYCRPHSRERGNRRYARIKLRLPQRLYQRQAGMCPDISHGGCGLPLGDVAGNHVDHLIPIARGGPDDDWNLQLMHPKCNRRKNDCLVPAAVAAATEHDVTLVQPNGGRKRTIPSCLLP